MASQSRLNRSLGLLLTLIVLAGGGAIFFFIGSLWASRLRLAPVWAYGLCGLVIWSFIYIGHGLNIPRQQEFRVIERLGMFYRVLYAGPHVICLPGLIDRLAKTGDFRYQALDIGVSLGKIEFADGSAAIVATAWWQVGQAEEEVYRWFYALENPVERVVKIIDGFVRPRLGKHTIDEAQTNLKALAEEMTGDQDVKTSLAEIGVILNPQKGFVISDVVLSEKTQLARELVLDGRKAAQALTAKSRGYADALAAIIKAAQDQGVELTIETARQIYDRNRAYEVLATANGRLSFVAPNMDGVLKTITVADLNSASY